MDATNNDSAPLRDIRPDLKARLRAALENRDSHQAKVEEFAGEIDDLTRQLDRENARYGQERVRLQLQEPTESLTDFILQALRMRPMGKEDLRDSASRAGYSVDGRSIHATVVNLHRTGRIKEITEGVFAMPDHAPTAPEPTIRRRV